MPNIPSACLGPFWVLGWATPFEWGEGAVPVPIGLFVPDPRRLLSRPPGTGDAGRGIYRICNQSTMRTAILPGIHLNPSDFRGEAWSGPVSTGVGDHLGTLGAVRFLHWACKGSKRFRSTLGLQQFFSFASFDPHWPLQKPSTWVLCTAKTYQKFLLFMQFLSLPLAFAEHQIGLPGSLLGTGVGDPSGRGQFRSQLASSFQTLVGCYLGLRARRTRAGVFIASATKGRCVRPYYREYT